MSKGFGIYNHTYLEYRPILNVDIKSRYQGVLVSIDTGKATRPVLGVFFDEKFTSGKGAKISSLAPNESAQKAGIPVGAIITSMNGIRITDYVSAIVRIRSYATGEKVKIVVTMPTGGSKTFSVTLGSAVSN